MDDDSWDGRTAVMIAGLWAVSAALALGAWGGRLSYHEAFVAQAARELLRGGGFLVPTIGGQPWLEKPPLLIWLVAGLGAVAGGVGESIARVPSVVAGLVLVGATGLVAGRRFGPAAGRLAALVQATTVWTVARGRLAEADMALAALVALSVLAFDRLRAGTVDRAASRNEWRLVFAGAVGLTALAKGIGFGASIVGITAALTLIWDRDRATLGCLFRGRGVPGLDPRGVAGADLAGAGPGPIPRGPGVLDLAHGGPVRPPPRTFRRRGGAVVVLRPRPARPASSLDPPGPGRGGASFRRAARGGEPGDRLLCAWAIGPLLLLSLATVKNPHYLIHALPPYAIWTALSLLRLARRLEARGWSRPRLRRAAALLFTTLGLVYAVYHAGLAPWLDRRGSGAEPSFYAEAARALGNDPAEPLVLLYDDWDRLPYPTPFGPVPHDLALRLFYLDRPACWRFGLDELARRPPPVSESGHFAVLDRPRDVPGLRRLGRVETLVVGPVRRARYSKVDDRTFQLDRVHRRRRRRHRRFGFRLGPGIRRARSWRRPRPRPSVRRRAPRSGPDPGARRDGPGPGA